MKEHKDFYQRKLPHFVPRQGTFFLTYRLRGSIPKSVIKNLAFERKSLNRLIEGSNYEERRRLKSSYFNLLDTALDTSLNEPYWLANPLITHIVRDSLLYQNGIQYDLWTFSIMPNHVHALLTLREDSLNLDEILQRHERFIARQSNKILQRYGQFWENESHDHLVKDEFEFMNTARFSTTQLRLGL